MINLPNVIRGVRAYRRRLTLSNVSRLSAAGFPRRCISKSHDESSARRAGPRGDGTGDARVPIWLKLVGATDRPMPRRWLDGRADLRDEVGFTKRANVEVADPLVMYAIPQGRIIGIAEVRSHPIRSPKTGEERWPWRSKIEWTIAIADYERCPILSDIEDGSRNLSKSVQRQSHIGLSWAEFQRAKALLERAFAPELGDRRV